MYCVHVYARIGLDYDLSSTYDIYIHTSAKRHAERLVQGAEGGRRARGAGLHYKLSLWEQEGFALINFSYIPVAPLNLLSIMPKLTGGVYLLYVHAHTYLYATRQEVSSIFLFSYSPKVLVTKARKEKEKKPLYSNLINSWRVKRNNQLSLLKVWN